MSVSPDRIVDYLRERSNRPLKPRELARALKIPPGEFAEFHDQLRAMEEQGLLYRVRTHRYAAPEKINLVVGRLQTIRSGAGFVEPEAGGDDLFIPSHALGSAIDGDRVVARVEYRRRRAGRPEGRVIKVLERGRSTIVGMYHPARNFGFVVPDDRKITRHLFVPPGSDGGAREGDVVVARVTNWGDEHLGPSGEVERVLGAAGEASVDTLSILFSRELPLEFPPEVEHEAERIRALGIPADTLARREDLRDLLVFTIDPADARDFDDALSIRPLSGGRVEVGVHIADVSAYVAPGGAIDEEALRRGTSVYLVDRVVPMLPEALSGDLCSLKPDVDRLAVTLLMELDRSARVRSARLTRSVIRSRHRLTYEDAQQVLDGGDAPDEATGEALRELVAVSRVLRRNRLRRGSLDFDLPEARVLLDTGGHPTDIQRVLRLESHRVIEDFMLLANETVAEMATGAQMPFIYRIHERPDSDRIEQLRAFAATLGHRLGGSSDSIEPKDLQRLLEKARDEPEAKLLSTIVLRSMKQARYGVEPIGHFGLAAKHYTHFTSPIRRYPDLVAHRLLAHAFIDKDIAPHEIDGTGLPEIALRSSERERVAADAERDSIDLKKVEFMERHLGDRFTGTISGVTAFGLFVLLDDVFVEGLIHVSTLVDDFYHFAEDQYALIGERTRRTFRLADPVEVQVASVSREDRRIDFQLMGNRKRTGGRGGRKVRSD